MRESFHDLYSLKESIKVRAEQLPIDNSLLKIEIKNFMVNPLGFEPDQLMLQIAQEIRYSECELAEIQEAKKKALNVQLNSFLEE